MRPTAGRAPSAHRRLSLSLLIGALVWLAAQLFIPDFAALLAVAVTSTSFVLWTLLVLWPMDPEQTGVHATREDLAPHVEEALLVGVTVGTLVVIGVVVLNAKGNHATTFAALGLGCVFGSWAMLHTTYVGRYARAFYEHGGGIDFNHTDPPRFLDFYYFSFNLGMTYAVSDTDVTSSPLRSLVLRHCLLSYLFSTVILAATINLAAGIATR